MPAPLRCVGIAQVSVRPLDHAAFRQPYCPGGMSTSRTILILVVMTTLAGCTHAPRNASFPEQSNWPRFLGDDESARCKRVALKAAQSPEMWSRLNAKRVTQEPLKLDAARMQCHLNSERADHITMNIPSGGRVGYHPCYIFVTIDRGTYGVLKMGELWWP